MTAVDRVKLNVGGRVFETTITTLAMSGPNSFFSALLSDRWLRREQGTIDDQIFIDRDPKYFEILLNLLRTGDLDMPENTSKDLLYKEAQFYGLERHLKTSVSHYLNGDFLRLVRSMRIPAAMHSSGFEECALVRGSPTGGFCVARENTVRIYNDWNLEEHHPLMRLSRKKGRIFDVVWQDSSNIFISTYEHIGFYNSITGELNRFFQPYDWSFYFKTLCLNPDPSKQKFFSSCALKSNGCEHFIAVWDASVGKIEQCIQISDISSDPSTVKKLQWQSEIDCLMVVQYVLHGDFMLRYIDHRDKDRHSSVRFQREQYLIDATSGHDPNTTYLMDSGMNVWCVDHRKITEPWQLETTFVPKDQNDFPRSFYWHNRQVFAHTTNKVFLFTGEDWVYTEVTTDTDKFIRAVSFGGNRMFSLHVNPDEPDDDEVRVWETPRCLIDSYH